MKKATQFIQLLFISFIFFSCSKEVEKYNPIGVWQNLGDPNNKIAIQMDKKGNIAIRAKNSSQWEIFSRPLNNKYYGNKSHNLILHSNDSLEMYFKELKNAKKLYKRLDGSKEGFWVLNTQMKPSNVRNILGEPDSISTENALEEWYYDDKKIIRFNQYGVKYYSENNHQNRDFSIIKPYEFYRDVEEKLGESMYMENTYWGQQLINVHYDENSKIMLTMDSLVFSIVPDIKRDSIETAKLRKAKYQKGKITDKVVSNHHVTVEEKGKIVDRLIPSFDKDKLSYFNLKGGNYNIIIRLFKDNEFVAVYSRNITSRRKNEKRLEVQETENAAIMELYINEREAVLSNVLMGHIKLVIKESAAKNTVVSGDFKIDIPPRLR